MAAGDDRALGHPAERGAAVERGWSLTCTGVRALLGRGSTPEPTGPTLSHDSATSMSDTISMKKTSPAVDLVARLRQAILRSEMTPYRIAAEAGVNRAILSRFLTGNSGLNRETASRICAVLNLVLREAKGG